MQERLRESLLPLYQQLLQKIDFQRDICTFCLQWGSKFPIEEGKGILFVGKSTNGWITNSRKIDILFGASDKGIFARNDQMKWVNDMENNKKGYNTRSSAFWRLIKEVTSLEYGRKEWFTKIAWSNLYKISCEKGNPTQKLKNQQNDLCKNILFEEIRILKPQYVIFLTSGWEHNFIKHLLIDVPMDQRISTKWGKGYNTTGYLIDNVIYITTHHPQGKSEQLHLKAIRETMNHLNR